VKKRLDGADRGFRIFFLRYVTELKSRRCGCQLARDPCVCRQATMPTASGRSPVSARMAAQPRARPTVFSAAMPGQLDTVKALATSMPECQRILGPHGITLLSHARAGGDRATL